MTDVLARAREMIEVLERGDSAAAFEMFSSKIRSYVDEGWSVDEWLRDRWRAGLEKLAGGSRRIADETLILPHLARFTFEGARGRAYVTIPIEQDGSVGGVSIDPDLIEGIVNIVITCPDERVAEMKAFYGALLGEDEWRDPRLVFDEGRDYRPPVWGDPSRPTQMHVDIFVGDLEVAEQTVLSRGAKPLQALDAYRTYADPIGHPFCLYPRVDQPVLGRVVIDCPEPRALAPFYEELLQMERVEDAEDRVVIAREDSLRPMLGFQQVSPYIAPRWPDPDFPPQMHFDMKFYDRTAAAALVESLGGSLVPPQGGSCPVYTDPAGHPFCLCMPGE